MAIQQANGSVVMTAEEFAAFQALLAKANTPAKDTAQPVARVYRKDYIPTKGKNAGQLMHLVGVAYTAQWNADGTPGYGGKDIAMYDAPDTLAKLTACVDAMHAALHGAGGTPVATSTPRPTSAPTAASFASSLGALPED